MANNPQEQMLEQVAKAIHQCHFHPNDRGTKQWEEIYHREKRLYLKMARAATTTHAEQIKQLQDRIAELESREERDSELAQTRHANDLAHARIAFLEADCESRWQAAQAPLLAEIERLNTLLEIREVSHDMDNKLGKEIEQLKALAYHKSGTTYRSMFAAALYMGDENERLKDDLRAAVEALEAIAGREIRDDLI